LALDCAALEGTEARAKSPAPTGHTPFTPAWCSALRKSGRHVKLTHTCTRTRSAAAARLQAWSSKDLDKLRDTIKGYTMIAPKSVDSTTQQVRLVHHMCVEETPATPPHVPAGSTWLDTTGREEERGACSV